MAEILDLGVRRLGVHVLKEQHHTFRLGIGRDPLQPLKADLHPSLLVLGEVEAGMENHPFGAEPLGRPDIGAKVLVDRLGDDRRILRHVHCRQRMEAERHPASLEFVAECLSPGRAVGKQLRVGVEADLEEPHVVPDRPVDRVLGRHAAADIDPDAIPKFCHVMFPLKMKVKGSS